MAPIQKLSIALIGMPGSGKTTIGRQLASRLQFKFIDTDSYIENTQSCSIPALFERIGEAGFRKLETAAISDLTLLNRRVISTGGGAVLDLTNRTNLATRCVVVYLHSSPEDLYKRLHNDRRRPLLQVSDPLGLLKQLYEVRHPLYQEVATLTVETGRPSPRSLVNFIDEELSRRGDTFDRTLFT